ncbi:MAG: RsmD family RNA methyltransferase [Bacteroidota bacterium]|nr:RsmD family RNA methyltransferase [Bacteroidota bacterium]
MRIISGSKKGHIIRPPRNLPIRPTTDISKEGIFNIINNYFDFEECSVLDLFHGGGSMSLEFCSRGVKSLQSVDKHPGCVKFLSSEAEKLGFDQIEIFRQDVLQFLRNSDDSFDLIFCDPPYAWTQYAEMLDIILKREMLATGGWCIIEHHSVMKAYENHPKRVDMRAYGQNIMSIFSNNQA